jgi:hypothetical protein
MLALSVLCLGTARVASADPVTLTSGSPTPEPASLLLVGIGFAAVWQSRRLRRAN